MPSIIRLQRIADRIRQDLSELLIREISDPRLQQVFITDAKVDRELAFADIYVSAVEGASRSAEILADAICNTLEPDAGWHRSFSIDDLRLRVINRQSEFTRFLFSPTGNIR